MPVLLQPSLKRLADQLTNAISSWGRGGREKNPATVRKELVRGYLEKVAAWRSVGPAPPPPPPVDSKEQFQSC